ncbi:aminopeptidase Q [Anabrus simplex]|uniref:aminopeptidase Q n=1 Tax=Anabrus simplex TaxID=316456 RepID=UPI0035A39CC0
MKLHLYRGLLLAAVTFTVTSSEFLSNEIVENHKLEKRNSKTLEESPLPRHVTPNSYNLELQPFLHEGHFRGKVEVNISCHEPTDTIVLHADSNLQVVLLDSAIQSIGLWDPFYGRSTFRQMGGSHHYERIAPKYIPHSVAISKIERNSNKDWYEIILKEKLKKGMLYLIRLEFLGNITMQSRRGLFSRNYTDNETNADRWYIMADLKDGNARKMFPCFDDPSFKANIQLSLILPISHKALSTMPVQSTEIIEYESGWKLDRFATSPPMAPQSFGFFIFDPTQILPLLTEQVYDVKVHAYGQASAKSEFQAKMKFIVSRLYMLNRILGISFPLPDLYLVALPPDHKGYRNNDIWGVITFDQSTLKNDLFFFTPFFFLPKQWIGHMATPDIETEYVSFGLQIYLASTSINIPSTENIRDAENLANAITWSTYLAPDIYNTIQEERAQGTKNMQAVWMWKMLSSTLTDETLRLGLHSFMHDKAFKTYNEDDIFEALNNQAWLDGVLPLSFSVRDIAKSWIDEKLFPVVTVTRNYAENLATIEQHPYLPKNKKNQTQENKEYLFWVPVMYITQKNLDISSVQLSFWMKERRSYILDLPGQDTFIIVNPELVGLYWVNYDQKNWNLLSEYLLKSATDKSLTPIPEIARSKLLYDATVLAIAGELDFSTALNVTLFMKYERNFNPWYILAEITQKITRVLHDTPVFDKFMVYCKYLFVPAYKYFGNMELKGDYNELFTDTITVNAAQLGYEPALTEAKRNFRLSIANNSMPFSEYLCGILRWSDDDWELALQYILTTLPTNESSNNDYFSELVWCTRKPQNLKRILYLLFIDDKYEFSDTDARNILHAIHDYDTLLIFILDHWNEIKSCYGDKPEIWDLIFEVATEDIKTEEGLRLVSELYEKHHKELQSAKSIVEKSLTQIQENLDSKYKYVKEIDTWLDMHLPSLSII